MYVIVSSQISLQRTGKQLAEPFLRTGLSWESKLLVLWQSLMKKGRKWTKNITWYTTTSSERKELQLQGRAESPFNTKTCSAMMCICKIIPGQISIFLGEKLSPSRGLFLDFFEKHLLQHKIQTGSDTKILRIDAMKAKRYLSHISEKSLTDNQMVRSHYATQNEVEPWDSVLAWGE